MKNPFKPVFQMINTFFRFLNKNFSFSNVSSKRATLGLLVFSFILVAILGIFLKVGYHPMVDPFLGFLLVALIFFLSGAGILLGYELLSLLSRFFKSWGILLFGGIITLFVILLEPKMGIPAGLLIVIVESLFFVSLFILLSGDFIRAGVRKKIWVLFALVLGLFINGYVVFWLQNEGDKEHLVDIEKVKRKDVPALDIEDPSLKGDYEVKEVFYGSGNFRNRPEYGEEADIKTETVDGTEFLTGNQGFKIEARNFLMGVEHDSLPVNGHVWYPEGEGPFPLVLTVHGNHLFSEYSDPGYDYLGEHLASRGYIMVSVDENFLNGSMAGGLSKENDARAWMLLQHLKQWHTWNRTDTSMFYNMVDTNKIGLIGHSRGGEAVAIAGNFNKLPYYPDNAKVKLGFNYKIRSIIAIAPSDGQYEPAGKPNKLKDVNYFVIQGAHDADVNTFSGMRQYHRTEITEDSLFKASLYTYRSNHGQFNSVWGNTDYGWPRSPFLNKAPLLEEEEQQKIAKVYFTAFLDATMRGKREYIPVFRDHRYAQQWLPEDIYINRFEDNSFIPLCTFDEDVDVTTGSKPGVVIETEFLDLWKEYDLSFRKWSSKRNNALTVGWRRDTAKSADSTSIQHFEDTVARYTIQLSDNLVKDYSIDSNMHLVFSAANTKEKVPAEDTEANGDTIANNRNSNEKNAEEENEKTESIEEEEKKNSEDDEEEEIVQVDFSIKLTDDEGNEAKMSLSEFGWIPPVLESEFLKWDAQNKRYGSDYEVTLQDFRLPLKTFIKKNPDLNPEALKTIEFIFDQTPEGVVVMDRIGFTR